MFEILFTFGPLSIRTFTIFLVIGITFGCYFILRYVLRKKMNTSFLSKHGLTLSLVAICSGRLFYVAQHLSFFLDNPLRALSIWDLKFSLFGVVYGALFMLLILCLRHQENFWNWLDAFALAGLVSLFFISLGHFFEGTSYGLPTGLPWGIVFDTPQIPFVIPIHPTQLYTALAVFIIFSYLMRYDKRHHQPGAVGAIGIFLTGITLLGVDFLHGLPSYYLKINAAVMAVAGFGILIFRTHAPSSLAQSKN